ncbi:hypothetical protein FAI40_04260 [Acetobacteraceae bacterium]|nr:hypothetical protein FAI40_04260 [Acetobacteraceae bacterium]
MKKEVNRHERRKAKVLKIALGKKILTPPKFLCLEQNTLLSLHFFWELREAVNKQDPISLQIHLGNIEKISFATSIALTAEFQRWELIEGEPLRPMNPEAYQPQVAQMLTSVGFFEQINCPNDAIPKILTKHWIPIQSGEIADPTLIGILQEKFSSLDKKNWNLTTSDRRSLFEKLPLIEGIANSIEHAYPKLSKKTFPEFEVFRQKRWWVSAQLDEEKGTLEIVCVDLGITIPKSIEIFHKEIPPTSDIDDIHRLFWACDANKSSTNKSNRGKGFSDILHPTSLHPENKITIISGFATACFSQKIPGKGGEGTNNPIPYPGTLIKWHIKLSPPLS